jgi:hypothetical protein
MPRHAVCIGIIVVAAVTACGDRNTSEDNAAADTVPAATEPAPGSSPSLMVGINPVDNSGLNGMVELHHTTDTMHVIVKAAGIAQGTKYTGHLHRGGCADVGKETGTIETFDVTANTAGEIVGAVANTKMQPESDPYFLELHTGGKVAACGDIPQHSHSPAPGA